MRATTRQRPPAPRGDPISERGTALILVPAMTLVLLALGSIAVDLSMLHGAHRAVHRTVSAAADDAAGMIDTREVQRTGSVRIDPAAARRVVLAHLEASRLPGELVTVEVQVSADLRSISVRTVVRIEHVMLRAVPGAGDDELLTVTAHARLLA